MLRFKGYCKQDSEIPISKSKVVVKKCIALASVAIRICYASTNCLSALKIISVEYVGYYIAEESGHTYYICTK